MTKKEMLALAAIVASAYGIDTRMSKCELIKSSGAAYVDMLEECFIR